MDRMNRMLCSLVMLLLSAAPSLAQQGTCSDGSRGYVTMSGLNNDIEAEANRIENGGTPMMMYLYRLCPDNVIAVDEPLKPLLSGSVFRCGEGMSNQDCRFSGGQNQVFIGPSTIPNYAVTDVRFEGVTFTGFTGTAINGTASSTTTVIVEDGVFTDFTAAHAIEQPGAAGGGAPFGVKVFDSTFRNANGGSLLSVNGGSLVIQGTQFIDSDAMAIAAAANGGVIMVSDSNVGGGNIVDGFAAMSGSTIQVDNVEVSGMSNIEGAVYSLQGRSTGTISNSLFMNNDPRESGTATWYGARAQSGSTLTMTNVNFVNNFQLRAGVSGEGESTVNLSGVSFQTITGSRPVDSSQVSSVVFINANATGNINEVEINDVTGFTASLFNNGGSTMTVARSCLLTGMTDGAAYTSEDSEYSGTLNYINDTSYRTLNSPLACPGPGNRLIVENPGSNCFEGGPCTTTCEMFSGSEVCLAQANSPTTAPESPTPSPLSNSTTAAPTFRRNGTAAPTMGRNRTAAPTRMRNATAAPTDSRNGTASPTAPRNGTTAPSMSPGSETDSPTSALMPSTAPSTLASVSPTLAVQPTTAPMITLSPTLTATAPTLTGQPTTAPTETAPSPAVQPSTSPSIASFTPTTTVQPTTAPTETAPTPADQPSSSPSIASFIPTMTGTTRTTTPTRNLRPSALPTATRTSIPTTMQPTTGTINPTPSSQVPSAPPSTMFAPSTSGPTNPPTAQPSPSPPTSSPTFISTEIPSASPSVRPSNQPSLKPSKAPITRPSVRPSTPTKPACDCGHYWRIQQNTQIANAYGYTVGYGYGSKTSPKKGMRNIRRVLPLGPPKRVPKHGVNPQFVTYHYDPCGHYCQWIVKGDWTYYGN